VLKKRFQPKRSSNRMRSVGDLVNAHTNFMKKPSNNLRFLLENRYQWMNEFIGPDDKGLEVGCGIGVSNLYIQAKSFLMTDFNEMEWLDVKNVDAMNTPFPDRSFNFVISCNMIHHLAFPMQFFKEMQRILKDDGVLIIQEINTSLLCRVLIRIMRSEGYCYEIDVFDENFKCAPTDDYWEGNNAIPNLLFDDRAVFEKNVQKFKIIKYSFSEIFIFINSGGVTAKTIHIPLPIFILKMIRAVDNFFAAKFPHILALQRQIVLKKKQ